MTPQVKAIEAAQAARQAEEARAAEKAARQQQHKEQQQAKSRMGGAVTAAGEPQGAHMLTSNIKRRCYKVSQWWTSVQLGAGNPH